MQSRPRYAILAVLVILALAILACGGGSSAEPTSTPRSARPTATEEVIEDPTEEPEEDPTEEPEEDPTEEPEEDPTEEPEEEPTEGIVAGDVSISSLYGYVDSYDYFHVVGEVFNDTERPVSGVELTLELTDGEGNTVLQDFDGEATDFVTFSPLLYTLGPGESSPFDYYVSADAGEPGTWDYTVTVTGMSTGEVDRAELEVSSDQIVADEFGTLYMSGELVNLSDAPVLINGLAGALLDDNNTILAADASFSYARYLAPAGDESGNDRTPFLITLDGPADDATQSYYYWDADLTEEAEFGSDVAVEITNGYVDEFDRLHIAAEVSNLGDTVLNVSLVAGVYDADGIVLDASTLSTPIYVAPGDIVPVTFEFFSNVNSNPDEMARIDSYTIQIDRYWTYEASFDFVSLETANEDNEATGDAAYAFVGEVTNTSEENLSSATIILAIYDADDNLVTSNWTSVYPEGDVIAPGDTLEWELTIYLPPDVDTTDYTFFTFVQGYID